MAQVQQIKKYRVLTPLMTDPALPVIPAGATVELLDEIAAPLLAVGAIEVIVAI